MQEMMMMALAIRFLVVLALCFATTASRAQSDFSNPVIIVADEAKNIALYGFGGNGPASDRIILTGLENDCPSGAQTALLMGHVGSKRVGENQFRLCVKD